MLKNLFLAFQSNGYRGYKSHKAQEKFAESLLKIADKLFWAPLAYLGVSLYQGQNISNYGYAFIILFFVLGVYLRHEALTVYDLHDEKEKLKAQSKRLVNK